MSIKKSFRISIKIAHNLRDLFLIHNVFHKINGDYVYVIKYTHMCGKMDDRGTRQPARTNIHYQRKGDKRDVDDRRLHAF